MRKHIILPIAFATALGLPAFAAVITGRIVDTKGEELPGAVVTLRSLPDSTRIGGTMADYDGTFIV